MISKRQNREKLKRIDNVRSALVPFVKTYENGIFVLSDGRFVKTYRIHDINFLTSDEQGQKSILLRYGEFLNSMLDEFKITVINRKLDEVTDTDRLFYKREEDGLDELRDEQNTYISDLTKRANSFVGEIYLTALCTREKYDDAVLYFSRLENSSNQILSKLNSSLIPLDEREKFELIYGFYEPDKKLVNYDRKNEIKSGHLLTDLICPMSFVPERNSFRIDERYGRSFVIGSFPQYLSVSFINELMSSNVRLSLSIDVKPLSKEKAIKMAQDKNVANETNIVNFQRKQNEKRNWAANIPFDMEKNRDDLKEFLNDLTKRDQRMFFTTMTLTLMCDSKEELIKESDNLVSIASSWVRLDTLTPRSRQRDGLITSLPLGGDCINFDRTLITEALSAFVPFKIQDIIHNQGIMCGINRISGNLILIDRKKLKNGNSWILGKPGAGKSFFAKQQILSIMLKDPDSDIIIIDPEREYSKLVTELSGEVINISSNSKNHINPFDINENYSDNIENPTLAKSEFIISIFEQILKGKITGKHLSVIDRCTNNIYRRYIKNGYKGKVPTFKDLYKELSSTDDSELSKETAQELALEAEIFIEGSLNTFAKDTNVKTSSRLICYDILDLGSQLLPVGMLVVLDSILNRITENRSKGKTTYIFIDEIYLLFTHEYTSEFLYKLWKRIRKYGGYCTGITQNVEDLLHSERARTMLSNSEFVTMLSQATSDRDELSRLLNISDTECKFIYETPPGEGLIHIENKNIPFVNRYDKSMKAYRLISTKPGENEEKS